jgi:hypothetical protein
MFGFTTQYNPEHLQYAADEFDKSCISYFDNSTSWNTILVHNIGQITSIKDVYHNKYEKTIAITFAWWYRNNFNIALSDKMDQRVSVENNKKVYKQIELFYFDEDGTRFSSLVEAV